MKHTIFLRRALALLLLLTLTLTMALPTLAASSATAADMRLVKTEGKVTVGNQSGKTLSVRDNMKLYSGYTISTDAESYAWLTLDAEKAVKLDASSALEVRKKGKKLELLLVDGKIYFDVSAPLDDGETMNIRTSTMVTGIRGTSGIIATSGSVSSATLLTGAAQVTSLTTGESMLVQAGTMGVVTPTSMAAQPVSSIDGFAAKEIQSNPDQAKAVEEATGQSVDNADAQLASDQAKAADSQQQLDALMQDVNGAAASSAGVSGISDQAMADILKDGELNKPGESAGGQDEDDNTGTDVPGSGDSGSSNEPPETTIWIREAIDVATLEGYLQTYEAVIITTGGSVTVAGGETLNIPKGKTLQVVSESGNTQSPVGTITLTGDMVVDAGATLITDSQGTITGAGKLAVLGQWDNKTDFLFTGNLEITITGTFNNLGSFTQDDTNSYLCLEPGSVMNNGSSENTTATFTKKNGADTWQGTFNNYGTCTISAYHTLAQYCTFNNNAGATFQTVVVDAHYFDMNISQEATFNNAGTAIFGSYLNLNGNGDKTNPAENGKLINNGDNALMQFTATTNALNGIITNSNGTFEINESITVNGSIQNDDIMNVNAHLALKSNLINNGILYAGATINQNGSIDNTNGYIYGYPSLVSVNVIGRTPTVDLPPEAQQP